MPTKQAHLHSTGMNNLVKGEPGYYLLSDLHPEDKQLREFLQKRKLVSVLHIYKCGANG